MHCYFPVPKPNMVGPRYYRLAVLHHGHPTLQKLPTSDKITELLSTLFEQSDLKDVAKDLVAELVKSAHSPAEQHRLVANWQ